MGKLKQELWFRIARGESGAERGSGECWQWQAKGQCSKGNSCSFRHDGSKRVRNDTKVRAADWER